MAKQACSRTRSELLSQSAPPWLYRARLLDKLVGKQGLEVFLESDLREMLRLHILDDTSDVGHVEGRGALNFLAIDDRSIREEGEPLDPGSILSLRFEGGRARFPSFEATPSDPFLNAVHRSHRKWIVFIDERSHPRLVLNANAFLRAVLLNGPSVNVADFCHEPLVLTDPQTMLEAVLSDVRFRSRRPGGDPLHPDVVLLWTADEKRILTGVDLLENLLRGIANDEPRVDEGKQPS